MSGRAGAIRLGAALAATLALLLAPALAQAAWEQPVGGEAPINREAGAEGTAPSIEEYAGVPYVAWAENGQIQAARLSGDGTAWERPEDSPSPINLSPSADAEDPTLRRNGPGEPPCVAFDEAAGAGTQIHMSCLTTATDWTTIGDSPNKDPNALAAEPSLTIFEGISWIAWSEVDSHGVNQIRVAKLPAPGEHWQRVPDTESPINIDAGDKAFHPSLVVVGSNLYVAWNEVHEGVNLVHVARLDSAGDGWEAVGGALNKEAGHDAFEPSMADVGGVPYVAFSETNGLSFDQARVARLDGAGTGWELVADSASPINREFNKDAEHPSLAAIGGVPYVAWSEKDAHGVDQVRVARLNAAGTAWEAVVDTETPINDNAQLPAVEPSLAAIGGFPYVGWSEVDMEAHAQVRVSRLVPEFLGAEATDLSATGATLQAKVHTYGLPFPVGFEYGATLGDHETTPVAAPAGQEEPTISQTVGALTAKTHYVARPFATAGVPLRRLSGSSFGFDTPSPMHALTVTLAGTGSGTVTSTPAGIACGSSCEGSFEAGATVTLEATPLPGSTFAGWSGGCTGTSGCQVVLEADTTVTATFAPSPPGPGDGAGSPAPSPTPSGSTPPGPAPTSAPPSPPGTKLLGARINSSAGRATFRFKAVGATAGSFRCALRQGSKRAKFRRCRSPQAYRKLKPGGYTFEVQAVGSAGADATPAIRRFRIQG